MLSVLVDTSVWSEHFKKGNPHLEVLLNNDQVVSHEFVIGEIALGLDVKHHGVLDNLMDLRTLSPSSLEYYLLFLSLHQIVGRKIGCVDTHLLISCITHGVKLWTLDKHLSSVAHELHIGYPAKSE